MEWTIIFLNLMYAVIGVVLMFVSYKVFDLLSPKINFEEELKKGNIAEWNIREFLARARTR